MQGTFQKQFVSGVGFASINLARIVQEAITNVIKHVQNSAITVYTDAHSILISDDGIGMSQGGDGVSDGHGLASTQQRADSLGADFDVQSDDSRPSIHLSFTQSATAMTLFGLPT